MSCPSLVCGCYRTSLCLDHVFTLHCGGTKKIYYELGAKNVAQNSLLLVINVDLLIVTSITRVLGNN